MKKTIGEKIYELRKRKGMTQDELAEKMGVSSQAVSKWEKDLSIPDIAILIELSDFFHITLDELIREKQQTVQYAPIEERKNFDEMFLRVHVSSVQGDIVKVNLPLAFVKIALQMNIEIPQFNGSDMLKNIDLNTIIMMVENGVIGKLVEVESSEGDLVEVMVD